ncbi:MAG TPA: polysaccharide biosynthesis/export family protein [Thermoanaerobaculia bacterium]|nr:polysaccharide biosynthesis/export family protein [Thermoanaerobaculia bacterium]
MKSRGVLVVALLLLAVVAGAQELPILSADAPVGPRDVLDIKVLEDANISGRTVINDDGVVALNVIGRVQVAGLTSTQIEAKLKSLLEADILTKATVSVQVVEFASKPISVVGAVVRPGRIGASGNTTLIQAITQAGGLTAGHGKELYVLRTGRNGLSEQVAINIDQLMVEGRPELNIPLAPNDLVNVPLDAPIAIYVMGEVMKPGKLEFRSSQTPTLLQAIAAAGGQTDRASRTVIVKRVTNGREQTLKINYRDILKGKRKDEILHDQDTVYVDEALF